MEVEMESKNLVILFKHISLELFDVTQPNNGFHPLLSIVYYINIYKFLIFQTILIGFEAYCMI